jgi:hypothetical protein
MRFEETLPLGPLALGLLLTGCGGSKSSQTPVAPILPTPTPVASATPEPPLSASCARLPDGVTKYVCRDGNPQFLSDVADAIATLQSEQPAIFDPNDRNSVTNVGAYYVGLIRVLDRQNICAGFDGEELEVKTSNAFNEQYKVLTSRSLVAKKYIGACYPSWFPLPQRPLPPSPPGCDLPPSREIACGNPASQYYPAVAAAIDQVLKERPELFDYTQKSPGGMGWPRVKDFPAYYAAVIEILSAQGFCARFDGEEIPVKRSDDFTEHFKISFMDKYIRTGFGIYRGACYPAAF